MRAVVQLVSEATVKVDDQITGAIKEGLLVLLGVSREDTEEDVNYLVAKIANLRIFADGANLMNKSVLDVGGEMLVVSQFTIYGDCRKGRRPSYSKAAAPEQANQLYKSFISKTTSMGIRTASGKFQALMQVSLTNNGPITIIIDSKKEF